MGDSLSLSGGSLHCFETRSLSRALSSVASASFLSVLFSFSGAIDRKIPIILFVP
jgi:hypothetical protein